MEYIDDTKQTKDFASSADSRAFGINGLVQRLIKAHTGVTIDDFGDDNVRYDQKTYRLKIIDLGY